MPGKIFNTLEFGKVSVSGRKRDVNQDHADIFLPIGSSFPYPLLVLADGMGGYQGGEIASQCVLDAFKELYFANSQPSSMEGFLKACVNRAHERIKDKVMEDPSLGKMGSTVVAATIVRNRVHIINVGDSRAYLTFGSTIQPVSRDHSYVSEMVQSGMISPQEARRHPKKNILTMAINAQRGQISTNYHSVPFSRQDVLMLCSDGLWGVVPETMLFVGMNDFPAQEGAEKLAKFANQNGGPDNISILIAKDRDRLPVSELQDDSTTVQ